MKERLKTLEKIMKLGVRSFMNFRWKMRMTKAMAKRRQEKMELLSHQKLMLSIRIFLSIKKTRIMLRNSIRKLILLRTKFKTGSQRLSRKLINNLTKTSMLTSTIRLLLSSSSKLHRPFVNNFNKLYLKKMMKTEVISLKRTL